MLIKSQMVSIFLFQINIKFISVLFKLKLDSGKVNIGLFIDVII